MEEKYVAMKVFHLSVECYPIAKVGGLADVVGALPKYQTKLGVNAAVIMPWYDRPFVKEHSFDIIHEGTFYQGSELLNYSVFREKDNTLGFELYLIKIPNKLDRQEVYCYPDEGEQFIAFQHAILNWFKAKAIVPDIVHCHDHHVGLMPFLMKYSNDYNFLADVKTVATVHNGQYQGWTHWSKAILLPGFDSWKWGLLDWDGLINPLAALIKCCDAYTTVSEGYLEELYVNANGLQQLFYDERHKSVGIVNGIDWDIWSPAKDYTLIENYDMASAFAGKLKNKQALAQQYNIDPKLPLLVFIGRFAMEKGADLLPDIILDLTENFPDRLSIFILGAGDPAIQSRVKTIVDEKIENFDVFFGYDENLAHWLYASADFLLMPSRVEPCGLNQLYAMKYGTLPIVHRVGGLKDTVIDLESDGYGVGFDALETTEIRTAIIRAVKYYENRPEFEGNQRKIMSLDFSWDKSAAKYISLYNQLI